MRFTTCHIYIIFNSYKWAATTSNFHILSTYFFPLIHNQHQNKVNMGCLVLLIAHIKIISKELLSLHWADDSK